MKRTFSIFLVTAAVAMGPLAGAAAATSTVRGSATLDDDEGVYCHGEVALARWEYDFVEHEMVLPDGRWSVTANVRAQVSWTQDGEDFVVRGVSNHRITESAVKFIFKGTGVGSLGTRVRFDEVIQARRTADGYDIKQYRDDVYCTPARR